MIRRLCDYQSKLADEEYVFITYANGEYGCKVTKEDVLVPVDSNFIEINRPETSANPYPCMLNINSIIRVTICKETKIWRPEEL